MHRQSAYLGKRHATERKAVFHFEKVYIRLVELHVDAQQIAAGGHSLVEHELHVAVERVEQVDVALGQTVLGVKRHHGPVSGVDGINHVLALVFLKHAVGLLLDFCQTVHSHDFTTHIDGLGERHGAEKHVVDVELHRLLGDERHLRRNWGTVRSGDGLMGNGVCHYVELIALRSQVEALGRQKLVGVEERQLFLVIGIPSGEIECGQIGREGLLALVAGLAHALGLNHQLLIVAQGHGAAGIERICLGCSHRHRYGPGKEDPQCCG